MSKLGVNCNLNRKKIISMIMMMFSYVQRGRRGLELKREIAKVCDGKLKT